MAIKVLVVDDSSFFRRRVSEIMEQDPDLEVIATATNGLEAIKVAQELRPDVITMDIEMPVMDGITAVREIMVKVPTPILMFSSLTHDGAKATLDALDAGALDFLPKRFEDIATNKADATNLLQQRVKALGKRRVFRPIDRSLRAPVSEPIRSASTTRSSTQVSRQASASSIAIRPSGKSYKLLAIGTSTGGPVALQNILSQFPANYPLPILLIQHMPAAFTPAFAQRLDALCKIGVKEAVNGDALQPGCAYLAPGGMQMMVERAGSTGRLKIIAGSADMNYKPCVDITFASVSKAYGGDVLAVVLTGMGADGREGARMLKNVGATIWAQDESSCVVYGMPQAVTAAGISTQSISLNNMAESILKESYRG